MSIENNLPEGFADWLSRQLQRQCGGAAAAWVDGLTPLPGDAGFRHYYRFRGGGAEVESAASRYLAVFSPPETEKNREFQQVAVHFRAAGVCVPQIFASDLNRGFFLLENLGRELYLDVLAADSVDGLYTQAMAQLLRIQSCDPAAAAYPRYDQAFLRRELGLFSEWFVEGLLQKNLSSAENQLLQRVYTELERSALQQPQVVVHRDFHCRNLIYRPGQPPGVIDFQDAVIGPLTYDLVSLLRDCYIAWPQAQVEAWALHYAAQAQRAGIAPAMSAEAFMGAFDLMGMQRHIKVLGIFARLHLRDNKSRYLKDLPRVIHYLGQVAGQYGVFAEFNRWFAEELSPLIARQAWMPEGACP